MPIDDSDVQHVSELAAIGLEPEEITELAAELSTVLDHVSKLQELDTEDVPATGHIVATENVMRDDEVVPSWSAEAVLANAPHRSGDFFEVQAVLD